MELDWAKEIGVMAYIKSEIHRYDSRGLWPYHLPRVGASDAQVEAAEQYLLVAYQCWNQGR